MKNLKVAPNQKELLKVFEHFRESMMIKGFRSNMRKKEFSSYLCALYCEEKNELFHFIYEKYLYTSDTLTKPGYSTKEYFQLMSQLKRYEQYLYLIIRS